MPLRPIPQYRHVILPKELARLVPRDALLSEDEWRALGIQQTPGWCHYLAHRPEVRATACLRALAPGHACDRRLLPSARRPALPSCLRLAAGSLQQLSSPLSPALTAHPAAHPALPHTLSPQPHILLFRRPRGWSNPAVQAALAARPVPSWASAAHPQVLAGQFQ